MTKLLFQKSLLSSIVIIFTLIFSSNPADTSPVIISPNQQTDNDNDEWHLWDRWDNFPFDQIQMGMSNMDYGGMMELENTCFNSVALTNENDKKKSQTYWYRLGKKITTYDDDVSSYIPIEVGCWINNEFKATSYVTGVITPASGETSEQN